MLVPRLKWGSMPAPNSQQLMGPHLAKHTSDPKASGY